MISVILPTFNEKQNIALISKKLSKIKLINEVIFVDDRSTDGTFKEIKFFAHLRDVLYIMLQITVHYKNVVIFSFFNTKYD